SEEYHFASRNPAGLKHIKIAHKRHYDPDVLALQVTAPLKFKGKYRIPLEREGFLLADMGVGAAIEARRSSRTFDRNFAVDLKAISTILYLSCGTRKQIGSLALKRNTPNSGNLGSIETYVVALSIQGVEPGIYHYDSVDCALTQLNTG